MMLLSSFRRPEDTVRGLVESAPQWAEPVLAAGKRDLHNIRQVYVSRKLTFFFSLDSRNITIKINKNREANCTPVHPQTVSPL